MQTSGSTAYQANTMASALMSVGVLMIPAGFLRWYFYHDFVDFGWRDWVFAFGAPLYFALSAGASRAGSWMFGIGLLFQLLVLPGCLERNLNPLRDGSLFLLPILCLFAWAAWASSKIWEAAVGLPPADAQTKLKALACSIGITVSLFALGGVFLQMSLYSELFPEPRTGDFVYTLGQQARASVYISAVAASIMTLSLSTAWRLMSDRRRLLAAAKQAAEKQSPT